MQMHKSENTIESLLLSAEDSAEMLGIGRTLFYAMHSSGRLGPIPIKLGRRTLWNRQELRDWVKAGCPARKLWQNRISKENERFY
jgi:predicted DNA-binding transcriptional regulator AlpA